MGHRYPELCNCDDCVRICYEECGIEQPISKRIERELVRIQNNQHKQFTNWLVWTDCLLVAIALIAIYLTATGTLPLLSLLGICFMLYMTSYENHDQHNRKNQS